MELVRQEKGQEIHCIMNVEESWMIPFMAKCEAREDRMVKYAERANSLIAKFSTVKVEQVPREENTSLSLSAE